MHVIMDHGKAKPVYQLDTIAKVRSWRCHVQVLMRLVESTYALGSKNQRHVQSLTTPSYIKEALTGEQNQRLMNKEPP